MLNVGIRLYNRELVGINSRYHVTSFKGELSYFLFNDAFHSVDQFVLFLSCMDCKSMGVCHWLPLHVSINVDIREVYCIVLCCIILYCVVLYFNVLYCIYVMWVFLESRYGLKTEFYISIVTYVTKWTE